MPCLSPRHQALPARRAEHQLHTARRTILFDANDGIDRAATSEARNDLANRRVRALLQARRDIGVMGVKDDVHELLDMGKLATRGERLEIHARMEPRPPDRGGPR